MRFLFGNYVIDVDRRELRHGPDTIGVEPQVFDLLLHLIRNRNHVVTKDDLLTAVWPGRIVSESTLFGRVAGARQAIGDSGARQRFIRTIARRGFRFVGTVTSLDAASAAVATDAASRQTPAHSRAERDSKNPAADQAFDSAGMHPAVDWSPP
jgi:DNA-binding winged helix-turn-helix (wHTH) protein